MSSSHCLYPSKLTPTTAFFGKHVQTVQMTCNFFDYQKVTKIRNTEAGWQRGMNEQNASPGHTLLGEEQKGQYLCRISDTISFT